MILRAGGAKQPLLRVDGIAALAVAHAPCGTTRKSPRDRYKPSLTVVGG